MGIVKGEFVNLSRMMIRKQRTADDGGIKIGIFIRVTESVYVEMLYYKVDK